MLPICALFKLEWSPHHGLVLLWADSDSSQNIQGGPRISSRRFRVTRTTREHHFSRRRPEVACESDLQGQNWYHKKVRSPSEKKEAGGSNLPYRLSFRSLAPRYGQWTGDRKSIILSAVLSKAPDKTTISSRLHRAKWHLLGLHNPRGCLTSAIS